MRFKQEAKTNHENWYMEPKQNDEEGNGYIIWQIRKKKEPLVTKEHMGRWGELNFDSLWFRFSANKDLGRG